MIRSKNKFTTYFPINLQLDGTHNFQTNPGNIFISTGYIYKCGSLQNIIMVFTSITNTSAKIPIDSIYVCQGKKEPKNAIVGAWRKCDESAIFERYTAQLRIPLGPMCCFHRQHSNIRAQHRHFLSWQGNESKLELRPSCFWNSTRTYGTPNHHATRSPETNGDHLSQGNPPAVPLPLWVPDRLDESAGLHHHIKYSCSSKSISVLRLLSCLKTGCANHTPIGETDYTSQTWVWREASSSRNTSVFRDELS